MSEEWDISLKRYELESLLKSFLLFFISLGIMLAFLFYQALEKEKSYLDQDLFAQMRLCSFDLKCSNFKIEFRAKAENKPLFLYHDKGGVNAYFKIPHSTSYYMKLSYPKDKYQQNLRKIRTDILVRFLLFLLIVAILALLFSFYALYPMKKALGTVEEFIKDVQTDASTAWLLFLQAYKYSMGILHADARIFYAQSLFCFIHMFDNHSVCFVVCCGVIE